MKEIYDEIFNLRSQGFRKLGFKRPGITNKDRKI